MSQFAKVKKESLKACMTCPLCDKLLKEATTISLCLHTFCRKCIYEKLSDEGVDSCPVCEIDLGCLNVEKLRPDHNLDDIRAKIFPYKRKKIETVPEVMSPPAKRKEGSLSSLAVNAPKGSMQSNEDTENDIELVEGRADLRTPLTCLPNIQEPSLGKSVIDNTLDSVLVIPKIKANVELHDALDSEIHVPKVKANDMKVEDESRRAADVDPDKYDASLRANDELLARVEFEVAVDAARKLLTKPGESYPFRDWSIRKLIKKLCSAPESLGDVTKEFIIREQALELATKAQIMENIRLKREADLWELKCRVMCQMKGVSMPQPFIDDELMMQKNLEKQVKEFADKLEKELKLKGELEKQKGVATEAETRNSEGPKLHFDEGKCPPQEGG